MTTLPREIAYSPKLQALPSNTQCTSMVVTPSNGQTFAAGGSIIYFDLPATGFLVPGSLYLRYNAVVTTAANSQMKGTPFATPFVRSEVLCGNQIIESIQQYGQLYNILVNTKLNYGQKMGLAYGFGLVDNTTVLATSVLNGRFLTLNETISMAAPLGNILSNADHLLPLCMMPAVRIQLTTDSIANMFFTGAAATPTAFNLSNLELCFDVVQFGGDVENIVRSMADENGNIYIKSQSYVSANQTVASATGGTVELVYNQRLSSIKSLITNIGSATINTTFESKDMTKGGGDYQWIVAGTAYPQRPISTYLNKAGAFMELLNCWGPAHDITSNNVSISPLEYTINGGSSSVSVQTPAKFYLGTNVEKLSTNGALLTGISSQMSPISFRVNMGAQTTSEVHTVTLICNYDALFEINVLTRQASVKQ